MWARERARTLAVEHDADDAEAGDDHECQEHVAQVLPDQATWARPPPDVGPGATADHAYPALALDVQLRLHDVAQLPAQVRVACQQVPRHQHGRQE